MKRFNEFLNETQMSEYSSYAKTALTIKDADGKEYGRKTTLLENFDIDKVDFENNLLVIHQTSKSNIRSILTNGFKNVSGFDGTANLISNKAGLQNAIDGMIEGGWGKSHKGSDTLIIFQFPKKDFGRQSAERRITLTTIDSVLEDKFNEKIGHVSPKWIECALIVKYRKI